MKTTLYVLFTLWLLAGCQNTSVDPDAQKGPVVEAPVQRKLFFFTTKDRETSMEEHYEYDGAGRLAKITLLSRMAGGKLEQTGYWLYTYDPAGRLSQKTRYGRHGTLAGWVPYDITEFDYQDDRLITERHFFYRNDTKERYPTGRMTYKYQKGLLSQQVYYDNMGNLAYRTEFIYDPGGHLLREVQLSNDGKERRSFVHSYRNERIYETAEYMPGHKNRISLRAFGYDRQRRLSTEETREVNPLLCVMMPGLIQYEYAD